MYEHLYETGRTFRDSFRKARALILSGDDPLATNDAIDACTEAQRQWMEAVDKYRVPARARARETRKREREMVAADPERLNQSTRDAIAANDAAKANLKLVLDVFREIVDFIDE